MFCGAWGAAAWRRPHPGDTRRCSLLFAARRALLVWAGRVGEHLLGGGAVRAVDCEGTAACLTSERVRERETWLGLPAQPARARAGAGRPGGGAAHALGGCGSGRSSQAECRGRAFSRAPAAPGHPATPASAPASNTHTHTHTHTHTPPSGAPEGPWPPAGGAGRRTELSCLRRRCGSSARRPNASPRPGIAPPPTTATPPRPAGHCQARGRAHTSILSLDSTREMRQRCQ